MSRRLPGTALVAVLLCAGTLGSAPPAPAAPAHSPARPAASGTGTSYYVDPDGSDTADGLTPATAWRSLSRVDAQSLLPGDTVRFKAGGRWAGQLSPKGSGTAADPVVLTSYGSGAKPLIDGGGAVDAAIRISDEHDIVVDGFEVTNSGAGTTPRTGIGVVATDRGAVTGSSYAPTGCTRSRARRRAARRPTPPPAGSSSAPGGSGHPRTTRT
ncbi:hypothetical protein [Streptomyces sp. NPDC094031]|uniref:hypothetical protein n=1 Tax=Streptomyces sp. NPDC094031 TaxID=3155307 RepID=UPI003317E474